MIAITNEKIKCNKISYKVYQISLENIVLNSLISDLKNMIDRKMIFLDDILQRINQADSIEDKDVGENPTQILYKLMRARKKRHDFIVERVFLPLEESEDTVDLKRDCYALTYEAIIEGDFGDVPALLDSIFAFLNNEPPEDYRGRDISVSDIIQIGDDFYHCQVEGWKKINVADLEYLPNRVQF